ncbi:lysosome-associated membrane glycoprotein 3 [Hemicordylus capensis]|uniref:lysosome-associated membrane glycoprotein 3 n=1 Tax=Hemicordylus capensis TaxID=884348 RepID=UPI0023046304|nr:lysosome-associated membrane glycoprotein 3 [Hemicordylus capensis]
MNWQHLLLGVLLTAAGAIETIAPAQKTISKAGPPNSPKTTSPAVLATTGNAKMTAAETTDVHITNSTAYSNMTSAHARSKTTAGMLSTPAGPTLTPNPSLAATGNYSVSNGSADCIEALIALTMVVTKNSKTNKIGYLNIDPNVTHTSGSCGDWLSTLNISFHRGFIHFTFTKHGKMYYVSVIEASLMVPSEGVLVHGIQSDQFFVTPIGSSFKCLSKQTVNIANDFQLLLVNSHLQAFDITGDQLGKEEECDLDRRKRLIPVTVGLSLAGLFLITLLSCVLYSRKSYRSYERI